MPIKLTLASLRMLLSVLIIGGFATWVIWYVYTHEQEFLIISQVSWLKLLLLYCVFFALIVCNGKFIQLVTSAFQIRLKRTEWLALSAASSFTNYFLPFRGGAGLRALYLVKLYSLPLADFIATLSVMYLMYTVVNGTLALVGMALTALEGGPVSVSLMIFFIVLTTAGLVLMKSDYVPKGDSQGFFSKHFYQMLLGWKLVRENNHLLAKLWLITLTFSLISVWQTQIAFSAISVSLSWGGVLIYTASKNLALLVSLTPGSLGIVETISIYLGTVLGYTTAQALLVQGLIRMVAISTLIVAGPLAIILLKHRLTEPGYKAPVSERQALR